MNTAFNDATLDQLFGNARTHNVWRDTPVPDVLLQAIYAQVKWGPTAANSCPARFVFVKSDVAKAKLAPALDEGNRAKTLQAPVNVIVATDFEFYEQLPKLFPHTDARSWFVRADMTYIGKRYDSIANFAYVPGQLRTNLRGGLRAEKWDVTAFVTNLFDRVVFVRGTQVLGAVKVDARGTVQ